MSKKAVRNFDDIFIKTKSATINWKEKLQRSIDWKEKLQKPLILLILIDVFLLAFLGAIVVIDNYYAGNDSALSVILASSSVGLFITGFFTIVMNARANGKERRREIIQLYIEKGIESVKELENYYVKDLNIKIPGLKREYKNYESMFRNESRVKGEKPSEGLVKVSVATYRNMVKHLKIINDGFEELRKLEGNLNTLKSLETATKMLIVIKIDSYISWAKDILNRGEGVEQYIESEFLKEYKRFSNIGPVD